MKHFQVCIDLIYLLLSGGITAEVVIKGDRDRAAGTGRRRPDLAQVQGPNTVIIAGVAVKAGGHTWKYYHV